MSETSTLSPKLQISHTFHGDGLVVVNSVLGETRLLEPSAPLNTKRKLLTVDDELVVLDELFHIHNLHGLRDRDLVFGLDLYFGEGQSSKWLDIGASTVQEEIGLELVQIGMELALAGGERDNVEVDALFSRVNDLLRLDVKSRCVDIALRNLGDSNEDSEDTVRDGRDGRLRF